MPFLPCFHIIVTIAGKEDDDQHDDDDLPEEEVDDHRQDRQAMMTEASQEREIASFPPLAAALINTRKYWGCSEYE